ncbi:hypothetical protein ARTHRO8AJ_370157 [Arthrobacter sp. 8AJ]|nr:hypothetical protein ARTHRO8AJ_370157 [Arthrobacter sp. 8AJ]
MVFALGLPAVDVPDRGILPSSGFRPGCLRLCADCPTTVSMLSIKCKAYLVIFFGGPLQLFTRPSPRGNASSPVISRKATTVEG